MLRHNLLLIYRNFKRFKGAFIINLVGLSTGLACALLIWLWVDDELAVDRFEAHSDRLYHVMEHREKAGGLFTSGTTSAPAAEALAAEMPEIEYAVVTSHPQQSTLSIGDNNIKALGKSAGKDYFRVFTHELLQGDRNKILADKNAIVLSEALALKMFGTTAGVVGKILDFDHSQQLAVTGIFKTVPLNATEQFDFIFTFENYREGKEWIQYWGNTGCYTHVLMKAGTDIDGFNKKIAGYVKLKTNNSITHRAMFLKQYTEKYLFGNYENGIQTGGRITYVKLFATIAVFILLIACINFMNLSTAKASRRIKEVGIKKAVGAGRNALIFQYMGESVLMSFLSLLTAVLIVDLLLPSFNVITAKHLTFGLDTSTLSLLAGVTIFTGLVAGSYPALYLSGFTPASILKGKFHGSLGELWARKGLVVFQFVLSVIFIVAVIVVYKQVEFVQAANLGYSKDNVIYFQREGKLWGGKNHEAFLSEARNIPGVINASVIAHDMTGHNSGTYALSWPGKDPEDRTEFENITVDYGAAETVGFQMAAGRTFSRDFPADTAAIIFNEAAIAFMGLADPVGQVVRLWGENRHIIGVAKDFNFESLHESIKPAFLRLGTANAYLFMVKFEAGTEKKAIELLGDLHRKHNPGFILDYTFLDADYQAQYSSELRVAILSKYFAGLAIVISCLGLFGLAAFTAERRLKEIGIRKVLGSTGFGIVLLLSRDFTRIVLTAIIIALPLSYLMTQYWLDNFAYKMTLEWWFFAGAGLTALLIAWLTVGTQAIKASRVNPVKCLKDE